MDPFQECFHPTNEVNLVHDYIWRMRASCLFLLRIVRIEYNKDDTGWWPALPLPPPGTRNNSY